MGRTRKIASEEEIAEQRNKVRYIGTHPYLQKTTGIAEWNEHLHSWLYQPAGKIAEGLTGEWFRINSQSIENE